MTSPVGIAYKIIIYAIFHQNRINGPLQKDHSATTWIFSLYSPADLKLKTGIVSLWRKMLQNATYDELQLFLLGWYLPT